MHLIAAKLYQVPSQTPTIFTQTQRNGEEKKPAKHRDQTKNKPIQSENLGTAMKKCHFYTQVHIMRKESCPAWGEGVYTLKVSQESHGS